MCCDCSDTVTDTATETSVHAEGLIPPRCTASLHGSLALCMLAFRILSTFVSKLLVWTTWTYAVLPHQWRMHFQGCPGLEHHAHTL